MCTRKYNFPDHILDFFLAGHGKDGLSRSLRAQSLVHDEEHDEGKQGREDGAEQVVRAAVLGHGHHLGNHVADQVHPRNRGTEREAGNDKVGGLGHKLGRNLSDAHFNSDGEKKSSGTKDSAWTIVVYFTLCGSSSSSSSSSTNTM